MLLSLFQAFKQSIVTRFQNIEQGSYQEVTKMSDVKNEVIIITGYIKPWAKILTSYSNGELIDLDLGKNFNESK